MVGSFKYEPVAFEECWTRGVRDDVGSCISSQKIFVN